MKIWIFNNYNMLPEQGGLNRHFYFGKYLHREGHEPIVFVGSHPHNTNLQLIEDKKAFSVYRENPFPWVLIRTCTYGKSRKKQVLSMFQYYWNARKAARHFEKPDAVIGSSAHPLAAVLAIHLGRKYHCKSIVEVRDLWPESIVVYGIAGPKNPAVIALRWLEKWIYKKADAVVFTMAGAYDYIVKQGWEKEVPREKVYHINNGVDLEQFEYNKENYRIEDEDLENPDIFKVVYAGSIRKVNNLGLLLDAAKEVKDPRVKFLVWGDGNELPMLKQRLIDENITNVIFKGWAEKNYIPYIVSKADLNIVHSSPSPMSLYGPSLNKMFDYLAAERPVFFDRPSKYNPVVDFKAGTDLSAVTPKAIAAEVERYAEISAEEYEAYCQNAKRAAEAYDFANLTQKLIQVIEG